MATLNSNAFIYSEQISIKRWARKIQACGDEKFSRELLGLITLSYDIDVYIRKYSRYVQLEVSLFIAAEKGETISFILLNIPKARSSSFFPTSIALYFYDGCSFFPIGAYALWSSSSRGFGLDCCSRVFVDG